MRIDQDQMGRFLSLLMTPGTVVEMRCFKATFSRGGHIVPADRFSSTVSGWYDDPQALIVDAGRLDGVSAFVTLNPCRRDVLARSSNRVTRSRVATSDEEITAIRWLYLDIDPVRPSGISSTAGELQAASQLRNRILADQDMGLSSIYGCSGNGAWALVRLPDYPNDAEHQKLVADAVDALGKLYPKGEASVDLSVKNPGRVMCLPGSWKCKGSNVPDRPWRMVTIERDAKPVPFDLRAWVAVVAPKKVKPVDPTVPPEDINIDGRPNEKYVAEVIRRETIAVATEPPGNRNNRLNLAAVRLGELVSAGVATEPQVRNALEAAARCAGLGDHETQVTIGSGLGHGTKSPRPLDHVGFVQNGRQELPAEVRIEKAEEKADSPDTAIGMEDNPHRLARAFLDRFYSSPQGRTLQFYRDEWYEWNQGSYRIIPDTDLAAKVAAYVGDEFLRMWAVDLVRAASDDSKQPKARAVTTALVNNILLAMSGISLLGHHHETPEWIEPGHEWPAKEVLPTRNAIMHLPSLLAGKRYAIQPTPKLFNLYGLPYNFDANAPPPARWLNFLDELWPDDQEAIDTLQEWFGLNLVADTSYQKILALIGPPRSGKGTIGRTLISMVGSENAAGPTLSSLQDRTGIEPIIDKLTAVIGDARLSGQADQSAIVERLLSISGEDRLTVDRKYRARWSGKILARFTLISNELPRLTDASGALVSRMIMLRLTRSFRGQEDKSLDAVFRREMSSILRWSIEGWKRLHDRGHFLQPPSGQILVEQMEDISSPISQFIRECCVVGPDQHETTDTLFAAWRMWCERENRNPGLKSIFSRDLRASVPDIEDYRSREGHLRARGLKGISLLPPEELIQNQAYAQSDIPF